MPKNLKRDPLCSLNVFYKPTNSKISKGVPFDRVRNFSEKSRIVPKKTQKGDLLVYPILLETLKNLWFSARLEPYVLLLKV